MTRSDLLEAIYQYYPRGILLGGLGYAETEEHRRKREAGLRGVAEHPTWKAMLRRLAERYPVMDRSWYCKQELYDGGYSGEIEIPGYTIGFAVSVLGPYYGIRRTGAPGEKEAALDIAREIEATYPGYMEVPPELGYEVVPEVAFSGNDTIYTCLFTSAWKWLSYPDLAIAPCDAVEPPEDKGKAKEESPGSVRTTPGAKGSSPTMTRAGLLEVVHRFYPRGILLGSPGHWDTEEHRRRREAGLRGVAEHPKWKAMLRRLAARYPVADRGWPCVYGIYSAGYWGQIQIPRYTISFAVSVLGPYYGICRIGAPGEVEAALDIAREIEATYPGYEEVPPELGNEVVPEMAYSGDYTIYDCLFLDRWKRLSYPTPVGSWRDAVEPQEDQVKAEETSDVEPEPDIHYHDVRE